MPAPKSQYWGYTLNNHTVEELLLVRNATTVDPITEHVYTPEKGESGTNHIQGWVKCSRQVRLTHLKKHWLPRANFTALNNDEYRANMRAYVQKQDATATAPTHQARRVEPMLYPALIPELVVRWIADNTEEHMNPPTHTTTWFWIRNTFTRQQAEMVLEAAQQSPDWKRTDDGGWRMRGTREPQHLGTHEAPLELVAEVAKRELVRLHRVETMIDRPEVMKAVRSYYREILARMTHNRENVDDGETQGVPEEASDDEAEEAVSPQGTDAA